ncbi:hypothetical protein [Natronospirillum sp.]|nr:hypothetical protein [Natronospirillum sp.]
METLRDPDKQNITEQRESAMIKKVKGFRAFPIDPFYLSEWFDE